MSHLIPNVVPFWPRGGHSIQVTAGTGRQAQAIGSDAECVCVLRREVTDGLSLDYFKLRPLAECLEAKQ